MERIAREKIPFIEVQRKVFEQELNEEYFKYYARGRIL